MLSPSLCFPNDRAVWLKSLQGIINSMLLKRLVFGLAILFLALTSVAEELPRPSGLEPDIRFWIRIFTEVTSQQVLIHDNQRLDIVYARLDLPKGGADRTKRQFMNQANKKYQAILMTLSDGKRDGLTTEEVRVLSLWSEAVDNDELRQAAGRVRGQQGLADGFQKGLARSARWEAYILDSLDAAGVPAALVALPHVESSYNPKARSHVGAAGLWQFTRSTGRRFMQIDHVMDERRDPYQSSDAAAALLKYNYSILNSWPLAITAYNHGVSGMRRAVRTTGTDDIETIVRQYKGRSFGFASRNFYVAFLAALDVVRSANVYFDSIEWDLPDDTVTVTLPYYMSVQTLVDAFGVSQHTLKKNNPALLDSIWTGLKFVPKGYDLRLPPAELAAPVDQLLASIPNEQRFRHQTPDLEHRIRRGDSLSLIAVRYNTTVSELLAINNLKSRHRIRAGQVLHLPYKGAAQQAAISVDTETYAVRSGDTLSQIAQRSGVSESELLALNGLSNGNRIYIGQELRLSAARVTNMASTSSSVRPAAVNQVEKWSAAGESPGQAQADVTVKPVLPEENVAARAAAPAEQGADTAMLADPSDYLVAADGTIEIQAEETLGHYASWLNIRTQKLRDLNGYDFRKPVVIGRQLKLDFTRVTPEQFLAKRIAYHRELQETFFARYRIADTKMHEFQRGDSLFVLSLRRYKVPVWLLRQYNPNLDLDRIKPGTQIVIPLIERVDSDTGLGGAVADA
jgi:membrane-bound lytic murein transglycosylase D